MDLDFSGMFKKTPLEKAEERKRLHAVPHSLDVMLVTAVIFFVGLWWLSGILVAISVVSALLANQWYMYNAAYRDGFRSGYITATEDHEDVGFIPERVDDHQVYTRFGGLD